MKKHLSLLTLLTLSAAVAQAQTHFALLGVGGESPGPRTRFDKGLREAKSFYESKGVRPMLAINGGHHETEQVAKEIAGGAAVPAFTSQEFGKKMDEIRDKVLRGEIKAGEQLLLTIDSHGHPLDAAASVQTHMVSTSDGKASLDKVIALRDLMESRQIRLAVMDLSCYSGLSQKLASPKTCVISAANKDTVGYTSFAENLYKAMRTSGTLEEAFLQARSQNESNSFPIISGPAGERAAAAFVGISPYLADTKYFLSRADKLLWPDSPAQCRIESRPAEAAQRLLSDVLAAMGKGEEKGTLARDWRERFSAGLLKSQNAEIRQRLEQYRNAVTDYDNQYRRYLGYANKVFRSEQAARAEVVREGGSAVTYSWSQLVSTNWSEEELQVREEVNKAKGQHKKFLTEHLQAIPKVKKLVKKLETENPDFASLQEAGRYVQGIPAQVSLYANKVREAERKLYMDVYKETQKASDKASACSEFKL